MHNPVPEPGSLALKTKQENLERGADSKLLEAKTKLLARSHRTEASNTLIVLLVLLKYLPKKDRHVHCKGRALAESPKFKTPVSQQREVEAEENDSNLDQCLSN